MQCEILREIRPAKPGLDGTLYTLVCGESRAVIWPGLGCNCLSWTTPVHGKTAEIFYQEPTFLTDPKPMAYGNPILFPFPNRIRDGRFTWEGKSYQLPIGDPQKKNAIHGFAFARPWSVIQQTATADQAWIKCRFRASEHAAEFHPLWPADYELELTYGLSPDMLIAMLAVRNVDRVPLPFGAGFHPYFRASADRAGMQLLGAAQSGQVEEWELREFLPTGRRKPLEGFKQRLAKGGYPQPGEFWDDAFRVAPADYSVSLFDPQNRFFLGVITSGGFRDLVIFTPPHRQAVCLEPYTCMTDAINLHQKGVDTGLMVLPPGGTWKGTVTLAVSAV
jgi:aldose 1-epimerase